MEEAEFKDKLLQELSLPFNSEDVKSIEENCGAVWIELKSGKLFSISVIECES